MHIGTLKELRELTITNPKRLLNLVEVAGFAPISV